MTAKTDTPSGKEPVGVVGLGRMGHAMALCLLDHGYPIVVHNRTAERAASLVQAGARWADSPAEVADHASVVVTSLIDDLAVCDVYLGDQGLLARPGRRCRVAIDTSTVSSATILDLGRKAQSSGVGLIDAPVAGPPPAARAGQLLVLAGGSASEIAEASPVLDAIGRRIVHCGPSGSGVTMKLVLMQTMAVYFAGLAESFAVGAGHGLSPELMLEVVLESHGAPPVLHQRADQLLAEVAGCPGGVGFPVTGVCKDLRAVLSNAQDAQVPAPVASAALHTFAAAGHAGYAERDLVSVVAANLPTDRGGR